MRTGAALWQIARLKKAAGAASDRLGRRCHTDHRAFPALPAAAHRLDSRQQSVRFWPVQYAQVSVGRHQTVDSDVGRSLESKRDLKGLLGNIHLLEPDKAGPQVDRDLLGLLHLCQLCIQLRA